MKLKKKKIVVDTTPPNGKKALAVRSKMSGIVYYLHSKSGDWGKGPRTLYYFSKTTNPAYACPLIPEGYTVTESPRSGMPLVKRLPKEAEIA